jgi:hypothetical protein
MLNAWLSFLGSRYSTVIRPLMVVLTKRSAMGQPLRPGDVIPEALKTAVPVPIGAQAPFSAIHGAVTGTMGEKFPGQYQKQMLSSVGIKTDQVPSASQRIRALAVEFNRERGVEPQGEFFEGPYAKLADALRRGDKKESQTQLDDLLKDKTIRQVVDYMKQRGKAPFTQNKKAEREFLTTLSDEQFDAYIKARGEREDAFGRFVDFLSSPQE